MSRKLFLTTTVSAMFVLVLLLSSRGTAVTQPTTQINTQFPPTPLQHSGVFHVNDATAETTFYPTDDASVAQAAPATNYGNDSFLQAGYDNGARLPAGLVRSYIKFDLSPIAADSTVASATLRVTAAGGQDYGYTTKRTTSFLRVTGAWSESTLNWNNRPGYAEALGSIQTDIQQTNAQEIDVTAIVQSWVNGTVPNHGVIMIGPESDLGIYRLFVADGYVGGPELVVHYVPAPPPVLDVWPGNLQVKVSSTASGTTASLHVGNVTHGNLNWTAVKVGSAPWLQINTTSGSVTPSAPDVVPLSINTSGLTAGTYSAQVRVTSSTPNVEHTPIVATVTLEVLNYPHNVYLPMIIGGGSSTPPPAAEPKVYALVVGVAEYQGIATSIAAIEAPDVWPEPLAYPDDDAIKLSALMTQAGFNVTTMTDSSATEANIVNAFATKNNQLHANTGIALNEIVPNTVFIFYYSGHGAQTPDNNGDETDGLDELIAPHDIAPTVSGFNYVITDDELDALLDSVKAEYIVVIIDSCFSGSMVSTAAADEYEGLTARVWPTIWSQDPTRVETVEEQLAEVAGPNRLVITGGTGDQLTWESAELEQGVFTYFFLQGLQDALHDANGNGRISAEESYWFSKDTADEWIFARTNEHQNPAIHDSIHGQINISWLP